LTVTEQPAASPADVEPIDVVEEIDTPRRPQAMGRRDRLEMVVALGSGISVSIVLCVLLDWRHPLTFGIWAALGTLVVEWFLVGDRLGRVAATDRVVTFLVWMCGAVAVGVLGWMLGYVIVKGLPGLTAGFFTQDLSDVGPLNPGGGALHAIIGTLEQTAIATVIAVPVGIMTAVYLNEIKGRMSPAVRFVTDAMSGLPSIVAGLLIYTLWVVRFGFSGIAAAMALTVVMLPIIVRTSEEMLRTVGNSLREASLALGAPEWRTVMGVVLPTARSGLVTASILGVARVVGETAPLLLTAFGSASIRLNPLSGQQADLPLFVYSLIRQPNAVQIQRAWTGALVLIGIVLVLFVLARVISGRGDRIRKGSR